MKVISGLTHIHNLSLALGFFDGLHQGHAVVIKNAVRFAKQNKIRTGVILFDKHPCEFFNNEKFEYLLSFDEKTAMLNDMGVDCVIVLEFNEKLAAMSPREYAEDILLKYFSPVAVTTGYNHCFGCGAEGNGELLAEYAREFGFKYFCIPPITSNNNTVSSSVIRNAVKGSDFELAEELLGYSFFIKSPVIHGRKIGRTINFPTANLIYPENLVKIERGTFYVNVETGGEKYRGVMNFGLRPTVDETDVIAVPEVHLLDFCGNLYGKIIKVSLIAKIRDEKKFGSLSQLKEQIEKDCNFALGFPD